MFEQQGFTLLELMISLILSCLVMGLLFHQMTVLERQTDSIFSQINETLEYAWLSDFLRQRLQHAGYTHCRSLEALRLLDRRKLPKETSSLESAKDKLTLRSMHEEIAGIRIVNKTTLLVNRRTFNLKYPVIIADCMRGEIHDLAQVIYYPNHTLLILQEELQYNFERDFYVGEWLTESFFIQHNQNKRQALFYKNHHTDEISPYIHSLVTKVNFPDTVELILGWNQQQKKLLIRTVNR